MGRKKSSAAERAFGAAVGALLAGKRRESGVSSQDLSVTSGVSVDAIRSIEAGRVASPGLYVVARIADALGVPMNEVAEPIHQARNEPDGTVR